MEYEKRGYLTTYFRFFHLKDSPQEDFTAHYHDFDKIILFLEGNVKYVIEGQAYELYPYDMLFIGHNTIHYPIVDKNMPYHRVVIYMDPNYLAEHTENGKSLAYCFEHAQKNQNYVMHLDPKRSHGILEQIWKLESSLQDKGFAQHLYPRLNLLSLMVLINRGVLAKEFKTENNVSFDIQIMEVLNYINANLLSELNIQSLAEHFFISKYYLMRKFKQHTGYTIHQYILNKRLILAKEKIKTGQSLTEICYACGFKDYSVFSRKFKFVFKKTPREYKQELQSYNGINYHQEAEINE